MGSALNSQVTFGEGFPLAAQVKRAEEPAATTWSFRPSATETGSAEERQTNELGVDSVRHRRHLSGPVLTENVQGVAGAGDGPPGRLSRTGVGPCIAHFHGNKGQVVMLPMEKSSRRDLFTVP